MNEKYKKFLPIGSVVMLENATKRLMITGFYAAPKDDKTKVYDYSGCLYPEGIFSSEQNGLFNHDQIKTIYAIGYSDEEEKKFKEKLNDLIKQKENNENIDNL